MKKVIRLTESDIESLVRKIIKEDCSITTPEFDWTCDISSQDETFYKKRFHTDQFQDYKDCCGKGKTRWWPATDEGERHYEMYTEQYGYFTVIFDPNSKPLYTCLGDSDECYKSNDNQITTNKMMKEMHGWTIENLQVID